MTQKGGGQLKKNSNWICEIVILTVPFLKFYKGVYIYAYYLRDTLFPHILHVI